MQINKNIKKIVGSYLESVGFEYRGEKEYRAPALCRYTRPYGERQQIIIIDKSRLDTSVGFSLASDAWGYPQAGARDLIPETAIVMEEIKNRPPEDYLKPYPPEMYAAIDACAYHINQHADWPYEDEEGLKNALMEIRDVIEKYGLAWLDKMSIEREILPTNEMGNRLYECYEDLSESFARKRHLDLKHNPEFDLDALFVVIRSAIASLKDLTYPQAQDDLVEMAAFLGEQVHRFFGGEWQNRFQPRMVRIVGMNTDLLTMFYPLTAVVDAWEYQDTSFMERELLILMDAKLPVSVTKMLEIQERFTEHWRIRRPDRSNE